MDARARPKRGEHGETQWLGFVFDVSETQQAHAQVKRQAELAHFILDNMLDAIVTTDEAGVITYANSATSELFGYESNALIGNNITVLMPPAQRNAHDRYLTNYRQTGEQHIIGRNRRLEAVDIQGRTIPIELRVSEFAADGQFRFMGALRDLRPSSTIKRQMQQLQHRDSATGLLNRSGFIRALGNALDTCITMEPQRFALLSIDIDDFHLINEGFGVEVGDLVIQTVAQRLSKMEAPVCARIHKDEFAMVIAGHQDTSNIGQFVSRVKRHAEASVHIGEQQISFRFSIGATLFDSNHSASATELLHQSQSALSFAKNEARGGLWLYDPLVTKDSKWSAIVDQKLKSADFITELYLVFQPQFNRAHDMIGYEALVRWQSQGTEIFPDQFIPLAERNGAIIQIGEWLVEEACRFLAASYQRPSAANKRLSINISPKQFQHPRFVETIKQAVATHRVDPTLLHLEFTERLLIESVVDVVDKMLALNKIGITFSLDDFGTGYSSLSYLSKLPLSELKIDRSFVTNLKPNTSNYQIVEAIISLSKSLGLGVIAEGVETTEEYALLEQLGCQNFQGYLFARPIPLAALHEAEA